MLYASYVEANDLNLLWISGVKNHLETNGMRNLYFDAHTDKTIFIYNKIYQRLSDIFHQEALHTIENPASKLRTYGLLKKDIGFENYLQEIKNPSIRRTVCKFRLSNHSLMIETF